jgi:hypothetical protein
MTKILACECRSESVSRVTSVERPEDLTRLIGPHALVISSISLSSKLTDGALVVVVNPISYGIYCLTKSVNTTANTLQQRNISLRSH